MQLALGLPGVGRLLEGDLERALLDNLQAFLLQLGRGFAFVGRPYRFGIYICGVVTPIRENAPFWSGQKSRPRPQLNYREHYVDSLQTYIRFRFVKCPLLELKRL